MNIRSIILQRFGIGSTSLLSLRTYQAGQTYICRRLDQQIFKKKLIVSLIAGYVVSYETL